MIPLDLRADLYETGTTAEDPVEDGGEPHLIRGSN